MNTLKHCLNPKVLLGVAAVAVALYFVVPGAAILGALPLLLILLVCPLSMVLMMWGMGKMGGTTPTPVTAAAAPLRPGKTDSTNS